ncbi:unnamed protein product [Caenorhabditis nigoni]
MADMDHSVLGFSAKKHAIILSGVFFLFFVVSVVIQIVDRGPWGFGMRLYGNIMGLALVAPISLFFGGVALLCLLKCNAKCLVIVCIIWPASVTVTCAILIINAFSGSDISILSGFGHSAFAYGIAACGIVLLLGSIHCMILLAALGFCSRSSGGADTDLYDLESSDRDEESNSQKIH